MLVKTEVFEDDGDVGDLCGFGGGGGPGEEPETDTKQEMPELKHEPALKFIPSRVRPSLDSRFEKDAIATGEEGGGLLRCPKCSITYRSRASMKNHTAVCKAAGLDPDAGAAHPNFCICTKGSGNGFLGSCCCNFLKFAN